MPDFKQNTVTAIIPKTMLMIAFLYPLDSWYSREVRVREVADTSPTTGREDLPKADIKTFFRCFLEPKSAIIQIPINAPDICSLG